MPVRCPEAGLLHGDCGELAIRPARRVLDFVSGQSLHPPRAVGTMEGFPPVDPIKSIAIAPTRSRKDRKPRAAGHPAPHADSRIGGSVGPVRRRELAAPASPLPLYHVGQRLMLQGGGNRWARAGSVQRTGCAAA